MIILASCEQYIILAGYEQYIIFLISIYQFQYVNVSVDTQFAFMVTGWFLDSFSHTFVAGRI
jgi:hypothetical protein